MLFCAFRLLSPVVQFYWVFKLRHLPGPVLRYEQEGGVNLYHCADEGRRFFVEVRVDDGAGQPVVLNSFVRSGPPEEYSYGIKLPLE